MVASEGTRNRTTIWLSYYTTLGYKPGKIEVRTQGKGPVVLVSFHCQLGTAWSHLREEASLRKCLLQSELWMCLSVGIVGRPINSTVSGTIPRQVLLNALQEVYQSMSLSEPKGNIHSQCSGSDLTSLLTLPQ